MTEYEQELHDLYFAHCLTGLLSDPVDHNDERQPGETCQDAVARLAYEQATAALKYRRKMKL